MESKNVRHTEYKNVGNAAERFLDKLQQKKKNDLDELASRMDFYFGAK